MQGQGHKLGFYQLQYGHARVRWLALAGDAGKCAKRIKVYTKPCKILASVQKSTRELFLTLSIES